MESSFASRCLSIEERAVALAKSGIEHSIQPVQLALEASQHRADEFDHRLRAQITASHESVEKRASEVAEEKALLIVGARIESSCAQMEARAVEAARGAAESTFQQRLQAAIEDCQKQLRMETDIKAVSLSTSNEARLQKEINEVQNRMLARIDSSLARHEAQVRHIPESYMYFVTNMPMLIIHR